MAETPRPRSGGHESKVVRFVHTGDSSSEFAERSKGLDSPRTPRPQPTAAAAVAAASQDSGSSPQGGSNAQASAAQEDGGPVNYNG